MQKCPCEGKSASSLVSNEELAQKGVNRSSTLTLVRVEYMGINVCVMVDMVAGGFASSLFTD